MGLMRLFKKKNDSQTHPSEIEESDVFALKPLFDSSYGIKDLDLLETIGSGSLGRVRVVRDIASKQFYALKILKKAKILKLKQVTHVKDEIKILSHLRCNYVVDMKGLFQDDNNVYILMEYLQGGELFSHLRKAEKFNEELAKFYCSEVASALSTMHSLHVVYRDLKPENVMIDKLGHIRLADFGFSKRVLDRTYTLCGTPEYLAPEVISGDGYGCAVDWWALGVLLFEMVCGYPPFYDHNPFGVYKKILKGTVSFPSHVSVLCQNVIKGFLNQKRFRRLGCTSKVCTDSLKTALFFAGIDWNSVKDMLVVPPFVPTILAEGDTSNFDYYPEEDIEEKSMLTFEEREAFAAYDTCVGRSAGASCL